MADNVQLVLNAFPALFKKRDPSGRGALLVATASSTATHIAPGRDEDIYRRSPFHQSSNSEAKSSRPDRGTDLWRGQGGARLTHTSGRGSDMEPRETLSESH